MLGPAARLPVQIGLGAIVGPEVGVLRFGVERAEAGGEGREGSCGDLAWGFGVFAMELVNQRLGVVEVGSGFPRVGTSAIALPADFVLELAAEQSAIEDLLDDVFLFASDLNGLGRWRLGDALVVPRAEAVDVEDGMDFEPVR